MINEKKENWFERRLHKKADREQTIIKGCVYHMSSQYEESGRRIAMLRKSIDAASEQVIQLDASGADTESVYAHVLEVERLERKLEQEKNYFHSITEIRRMLLELLDNVDMLIRRRDYKKVIKYIPERELPKIMKSNDRDELEKIKETTKRILSDIERHFTVVAQVGIDFKEETKRITSVGESMRSDVKVSSEDQVSAIEKFKARKLGTAKAVDPVPANAQENENEASRPTNLA